MCLFITIPPDEVIVTFLLLPSPNCQVDMGQAATPSASSFPGVPGLHTKAQGQKLDPGLATLEVRAAEPGSVRAPSSPPDSQSLEEDHTDDSGDSVLHQLFSLHKIDAQGLCQKVRGSYEKSSGRCRGSVGVWQRLVCGSDVSLRETGVRPACIQLYVYRNCLGGGVSACECETVFVCVCRLWLCVPDGVSVL